jgi:hypothetical protein
MATPAASSPASFGPRVVAAVLVRPWLWPTALAQLVRLAPRRWWATPRHVPSPDPAYLRFRAITAYGDPDHGPEPDDLVTWLTWCRSWRRATKVQSAAGRHD